MARDSSFDRGGVEIAYDDRRPDGDGGEMAEPIVLVHGFASSSADNWRGPGWHDTLLEAGRRVIALDCRGHGESSKPHDPDAYDSARMARDVIGLLDHLDVERADLMGYSMGGRLGLVLLDEYPERFNSAVLGGIGSSVFVDIGGGEMIAGALEADDPEELVMPVARRFRTFAEERGNDLTALAACARSMGAVPDKAAFGEVDLPVLVVAGENDDLVGDPEELAAVFPGGRAEVIPDRDHRTAVGDERYKQAVRGFLEQRGL